VSIAQTAQLPIVKIAAGAVIVLCAVGVGTMTGLIPGVSSKEKSPQAIEATAAPAAAIPATSTAETPVTPVPAKPVVKEHARVATAEPVRQAKVEKPAAPVCFNCGTIVAVNTVEVKGEASGIGAVAGGVAGLVVGNQIGQGKGKTLAKIAGAAGGAYAGHQIEKNMKKTTQYEIAVRMDDGTVRTITQASNAGLSAGSKVKIVDNAIVPN
jgi:outer membrane lipoprotein SlyB